MTNAQENFCYQESRSHEKTRTCIQHFTTNLISKVKLHDQLAADTYRTKIEKFKENAKRTKKGSNDPFLWNLRSMMKKQTCNNNELKSSCGPKHFSELCPIWRSFKLWLVSQTLISGSYFVNTDMVSPKQVLLPQKLLNEFSLSIHAKNSSQAGISKTEQDARQKQNFPCVAKYVKNGSDLTNSKIASK